MVDNSRLGYSYDILKSEAIRSFVITEINIDDPTQESEILEKLLILFHQPHQRLKQG